MKNTYTLPFHIFNLRLSMPAVIFALFFFQHVHAQCPNGTAAHYKLDGTINFPDFSGNNDGSCVDGVNCPGTTEGLIGGAQQFNGIDQYIEVPASADFDFAGSFTIEAWVKFTTSSPNQRVFVSRTNNEDEGTNQGMLWWVGVEQNSNLAIFKLRSNSVNLDINEVKGSTTINNGQWRQVVAVHDAENDEIRIYVDGALQNSSALSLAGNFAATDNPLRIGNFKFSDVTADNAFFDGAMDNIGIFNRALTGNEILQHFNNGNAGTGICPLIPEITSTAPISVSIGETYNYQVEATGDPVPTFSLTTFPTGMQIDANTGLITWTPQQADAGVSNVTVRASNSQGNDDQPFSITVSQQNDAPAFDNAGDQTVDEDPGPQTVTGWATNIDDGDPELVQVLTFNITGNTNPSLFAAGPAISESGDLTYTPADNANGSADITVTLSDDGSPPLTSAPVTFNIAVNPVNDAPAFTLSETEVTVEGNFDEVTINVTPDPVPADETNQTVIYTLNPETVGFAQVSISPITGAVTINPLAGGGAGNQEFEVIADDNENENNTFTQTFTLNVAGPTGLGDSEFAESLSVFPIPGSDHITLRMENDYLGEVKVKIFDMRGKMVKGFYQVKNTQQYLQELNVSDIETGTYFVHVVLGNDIILEKLLKN